MKMQCVLEDRTVVEKDSKLVFVIGEGDVNQVKCFQPSVFSDWVVGPQIECLQFTTRNQQGLKIGK